MASRALPPHSTHASDWATLPGHQLVLGNATAVSSCSRQQSLRLRPLWTAPAKSTSLTLVRRRRRHCWHVGPKESQAVPDRCRKLAYALRHLALLVQLLLELPGTAGVGAAAGLTEGPRANGGVVAIRVVCAHLWMRRSLLLLLELIELLAALRNVQGDDAQQLGHPLHMGLDRPHAGEDVALAARLDPADHCLFSEPAHQEARLLL
mmetsp:Transcript_9798/g.28992  ORF Transcript_9798/g.28992 Transcript_9798/m.28992 type:complete len:207 (+) Transcript_9798:244-864(+)